MKKITRWIPVAAVIAVALVVLAFVVFNSVSLHKDDLVGRWRAVDGESGSATFQADGTFEMQDMSFNPVRGIKADGAFHATGTWRMSSEDNQVSLWFNEYGDTNGEASRPEPVRGLELHTVVRDGKRALYFSNGEETRTLIMTKSSESAPR